MNAILMLALAAYPAAAAPSQFGKACAASARAADFGRLEGSAAPEFKAAAEAYRAAWRAACRSKARGAARLYAGLRAALDTFNRMSEEIQGGDPAGWTAVSKAACARYPSFIPAFRCADGTAAEGDAEPSFSAFKAAAAPLAGIEDRIFFTQFALLTGGPAKHRAPYRELRETPAGVSPGCLRFGSYNWLDALDRIESLKAGLKHPAYREDLADFETRLRQELELETAGRPVCACGNKAQVIADYEMIAQRLPELAPVLARLESGALAVQDDRELRCGGG